MSAPTVVQGLRGTAIVNTETRRKRDVTPAMAQLEPDEAPLVTLMAKLKKRKATDPKIEWFEDELLPRFDVLGGALAAGAATMTVTNYKYFRKGDLVRVNKKEIVYVSATPTTTSVSITRAAGETAAQAAAQGDQLHILTNTNEEGSTSRDVISTQRTPVYNFLQIIKTPYGVTRTQDATGQYGGQDLKVERRKQLIEHKKDIEYAFWLGERWENTAGTHPKRATRGVFRFLQTNVKNVATLTEQEFEDFLRICFRYGSKTKVLFGSPKLITVINGFARGKLQTVSGKQSYGVTMTQYENAGRKVMLVEHNLFTNDSLADLTGIAGYGALLDIEDLELRYLGDRLTMLEENIQDNDEDQIKEQYLSEIGLELHQERKHGLLTGVVE